MVDTRAVGKMIATLRQAKGLTQQQLAAALNVSHQAVSKWENGAALPDIQTLLDLTKLFGITVEQLLDGTVPEARLEREESANPSIGSFVNGVIDDIGNLFKSEPKVAPEPDDGAVDAKLNDIPEEVNNENVDLKSLAKMAPFMTKGAVEEMLMAQGTLTNEELLRFAPYVGCACLETLIRRNSDHLDWDQLRQFAPYLKKETVDNFARAIAKGEKIAPAAETPRKSADVISIEDVSRTIGQGVDTVVRKVVQIGESVADGVSRTIDNLTAETLTREERLARLRKSAFERAMDDGRWEWIEAHISEVTDESLKKRISERANAQGMQDWVCKNLGGYADAATIESAIVNGDWGWLGEHVWKFDDHLQQRVALAAMKAENWQWLSTYAEQIDLKDCVLEIESTARKAGARVLAAQLTRYDMDDAQAEKAALEATEAEDYEYLDLVAKDLKQDVVLKCCIRLAKQGKWDGVKRFGGILQAQSLEWLMQLAIDAGNFEAVDMLDGLMKDEAKEQDS